MLGSNVLRAFRAACGRAGITRRVRLHDLRHTAGSHLIRAGADVAAVSAILGHSSVSLTLQTYTQALPTAMRAAVEGRHLGGRPGGESTNTQN